MFLDEKLYQHYNCKVYMIKSSEDWYNLCQSLLIMAEDDWKTKAKAENMNGKEIKVQIDRAFRSWDIFVERISKDKLPLYELLKDDSYRNEFMKNEILLNWWYKLV